VRLTKTQMKIKQIAKETAELLNELIEILKKQK
jgi:hypothetical protein